MFAGRLKVFCGLPEGRKGGVGAGIETVRVEGDGAVELRGADADRWRGVRFVGGLLVCV
jgi:hypothetical protein